MFRRGALSATASLAVVLLAATGCKVQVSNAAPGGSSTADAVQAGSSGVTRSGPLIVEPGAGFSPVYSLINGARHSINVTMYEFSDTTAEHDLAAAAKRGVRVRVILDRRARSVNSGAYSYLGSHQVKVTGRRGLPVHPPEDHDHRRGEGGHHDRQPDQPVLRDLTGLPGR